MGEEVGVTDDDDDDDDDARLEITHISHITNMKILNRMRERCWKILVVDSSWVEVEVRSCQHSGVEVGADFGVKTLGPWVKTFPCVSCVKQI